MVYADVTVIVDGALEKEEIFHDYALMDDFIEKEVEDAESDGYPTEIFVLYHSHEDLKDGEECQCIQFEQDHKPYRTVNVD